MSLVNFTHGFFLSTYKGAKNLFPGPSKSEVHWYFYVPKREREGGEREERREKRKERRERREKRDERREMREQVSERIKVRAIIFLNRPGLS